MTYEQAINSASKVGASRANGDALLAITVRSLAAVHAINPKMAYDGAKRLHLDARAVAKLGPASIGDLMFA